MVSVMVEITEEHKDFVSLWIKYGDPFKAALDLYPGEYGKACQIANEWPIQQHILKYKVEYLSGKDEPAPISKQDLAKKVIDRMDKSQFTDDFIKCADWLAKTFGYYVPVAENKKLDVTGNMPVVITLSKDDEEI